MKLRIFPIVGLLLLSVLPSPIVEAQENLSVEVRAGFDAFYKAGTWVPVQVTVANQGGNVQARLQVRGESSSFSASNILYVQPVALPAQSRQKFIVYVPLRGQRQLTIELVDGEGGLLHSQQRRIEGLDARALLVGVVASDPSLLNALAGLNTSNGNRVAVAHLKLGDLPPVPQAWAGLDMLVFNDIDTAQLTSTQRDALTNWVSFGGQLVVGGGPTAGQTIAGLKSLLPFPGVTMHTLPHPLSALERFVQHPFEDRGPYVAAVPTIESGQVLVQEDQWPLITARPYNLGQVYYLAFDLGLAPLDSLAGQPGFLPQVVSYFEPKNGHFADSANWQDMRNSLALIPEQTLPTPGVVALYLGVYILVMGPLNYLILRYVKRREWAWFSIPAIILLFSGYGYVSGFRLRGGRTLIRQITVVQAEVGAPLADVDSFIGVYSPFRTEHALQLERTALVESLPDPVGVNEELVVSSGEPTVVENLRSDIGGMSAIIAHGSAAPPQITADLRYDRAAGRIAGRIFNDTGQPITLARLVVGSHALDVGPLPGGETQVDGSVVPLSDSARFYDQAFGQDDTPDDLALVSRDVAVRTMLGLNRNSVVRKDLDGLHLVGWQEGSPLSVAVTGGRYDKTSETLLLVGLPFTAD